MTDKPSTVIGIVIAVMLGIIAAAWWLGTMQQNVEASPRGNGYVEPFDEAALQEYQKPSSDALQARLTELQFKVTQQDGTEPAFQNEYYDVYESGIYVDIVSGEPLFSSRDKYDSDTGWPSFTQPIQPGAVTEQTDYKLIYPRTEIRSAVADSHLGHLFNDGPDEEGGLRYCMNSAAMQFVPEEQMEELGYGEYLSEL